MRPSPFRVVEGFAPVGLAAVEDAAALQDRVDRKYVISLEAFAALAERLRGTHAVLEIAGRRAFAYRTTYFDTAELRAYRDHVQRRRRRYKCRSREYLDTGVCTFEVKLKGPRGRTVKHRMEYDRVPPDELTPPALAFLDDCVERSYGRRPDGDLRRALTVVYTRITLVAPERGERLTCDFDLSFSAPDGAAGRLAADTVIVESKSARGSARADRELLALGARPEPVCSKYCLGVGFTNPRVKSNRLRPLLRRHFRAVPAAAVGVALAAGSPAAAAAPPAADDPVPRVHLRAAEPIRDEPKVPARLTVRGRTYRVGVEFRGNSSQRFAKKPYGLELERPRGLLGMPREDDWDLNAFHTDPSLLRDVLAHAAARRMGLARSRTRFVRLRVNRRARGVYVLMEPPERVRAEALLQLTERRKVDRGDEWFPSATGLAVVSEEGDGRAAVEAFEAALAAGDWRAHLDEASAVDYVLHTELFKNQDAFLSSTYVHLRDDGRLALGPVWDLDLSAGNVTEPALAPPEGWLLPGRPWAGALLADPAFVAALGARWRALRADGLVEALLALADRHAPVVRRNFIRWRTLDAPLFRNQPVHGSHPAAVAALKEWLARRAAWMDEALAP